MSAPSDGPRVIAVCLFQDGGRIFVFEGYDSVKDEVFYRPLGGSIEFGERGHETVEREIQEEIGERVKNLRYLGTVENLFTYIGHPGHEIVLVYDADFVDDAMYRKEEVEGEEENGIPFKALWKPIAEFREGRARLYPEGILELLATR